MGGHSTIIFIAMMGVFVLGFAIASGNINTIIPGFGTDLGYMYEHLLEDLNPEFLDSAQATCESAGGTWVSSANRFGCFNMPDGTFDTTNCNDLGYKITSSICESVNAKVVCKDMDVGCTY